MSNSNLPIAIHFLRAIIFGSKRISRAENETYFGKFQSKIHVLPKIESEEGPIRSKKLFFQSLRNAKAESIAEASSFSFGASRKQEQEECEPEVIKVLEMLKENAPKYIVDSYPEDLQTSGVLAERFIHEGTSGINERK
jgi:hypothetical protein